MIQLWWTTDNLEWRWLLNLSDIESSLSLADSLRARLQELRERRADLEKIREEVIKHLKNIHNRITLRRKEGTDIFLTQSLLDQDFLIDF